MTPNVHYDATGIRDTFAWKQEKYLAGLVVSPTELTGYR